MKKFLLAFFALVMCATGIAVGDYAATQGSGTTFGSAIVGGVHYVRNLLCDPTTVTQCAVVNSSGSVSVVATGLAQGSSTSGQTGSLVLGAVTTAAPSYTNAQTSPASLTTTGDLRTVFSNTTIAATQSGTWTVQPGNTPNTTSWLVKTNDGTNTQLLDPCQSATKLYQTISQTTNTQLFAGTSAKKTYVCHIMVVGADAENISLVAGTGSVCATNTVAVIGATTAANGPNLSANGGFSIGQGGFSVGASTVNADNICLFQSGSGRVAGVMTYVAQ